ncbi:MAG: hypothetical protein IJ592_03420 [Candidatus Methanomethylophilaceae archaeon]|nr:hypothetical protein [Candidatus Methanomethylophilaceae archaeon]
MPGYIDGKIVEILGEKGPMTTVGITGEIYPGLSQWEASEKLHYVHRRCAKMFKDGILDKAVVRGQHGRHATWSLPGEGA